jgi:hypothetical protein
MRGWKELKNAEQWCFSIGKTDERLLVTVFQQREENERLLVFQQREKLLLMVFQQWKGEKKMKQVLDGIVLGVRMTAGMFF